MSNPALVTSTVPPRARFFANGVVLPRIVAGLAIVAAWEVLVRLSAPVYVAKPSGIVRAIPKVIADPLFLDATAATLLAVAQGLAIAILFGTLVGLLIGRRQMADRAPRHYVNGFNALPMIVVLPLVTLWFGYTSGARLATTVFAALFSIIVNVADGARAVPRDYIEVARSFRAPRLAVLRDIVLPSATPYFLAGVRLAVGRALIGAVVAEFFTAIGGLGYFILYTSRTYRHDDAFVGVLLLAAFGIGADALINGGTRRFLPWYRQDEKGA